MSVDRLQIRLFGPFQMALAGEPVPRLRNRSVEWLLALLTLRAGQDVSRSWLAGTLWPESQEEQALLNLRVCLMRLRDALGDEAARVVAPDRRTLRLDLDGAFADVAAFDIGVRAGDEDSLAAAVDLHAGLLLEGCYAEWATPERDARARRCLQALETLAERAQARGDFGRAIGFLRRAEGLDPLRDSLARRLMACLAASGDPAAAIEVYRNFRIRLHEALATAPDEATARLFQEIRAAARTPSPPPPSPRHASLPPVPRPLAALIGREAEMAQVRGHLRDNRLVTLVGGGGVGKTRLALEVAAQADRDFAGGVSWVELAPLGDGAPILRAVAAALGLGDDRAEENEDLEARVTTRLQGDPHLLVLDNCEHLHDAAARAAHALLLRCPELRVLATSRQRLGIPGEMAWQTPSLAAPDPDAVAGGDPEALARGYPALRLLAERIAQVRPGFRLVAPEDVAAAARICTRLDGIPLAIELAAARAQVLSLPQIAARLDDRFRLLTGGSRTALPRQQTLRALIDWSHDLLTEPERILLRRLSVFSGGWILEAAEAVCGGDGVDDVLDLLASLADRSLVGIQERPRGLRYRMLETIREYAAQRLRESGEEETLRGRHLDVFVQRAQGFHPALRGSDLEAALEEVEAENGNFRAALAWAQGPAAAPDAALRLSAALWPFWEVRGHHAEGRERLRDALARGGGPAPERAQALLGATSLAFAQADWRVVLEAGAQSVAAFRELNDPHGLAAGLLPLGYASARTGDLGAARALLEEALAGARACGWSHGSVLAHAYLGIVAERDDDPDRAYALWEEGVAEAEATGDAVALSLSLHYMPSILGHRFLETGVVERLHALLERSLLHWRRLGDRHRAALTLCILGDLSHRRQGDPVLACSYYDEAIAAWREQGNRTRLAAALHERGNALYAQGDDARAREAYAEALELFDQSDEAYGRDFARMNLGGTLLHLGRAAEARTRFREALDLYRRKAEGAHGGWSRERRAVDEGIVWAVERLGVLEALHGDPGVAARLMAVAQRGREALGIGRSPRDQADWERAHAAASSALGADFAAAWDAGRAWDWEEAVAAADPTSA